MFFFFGLFCSYFKAKGLTKYFLRTYQGYLKVLNLMQNLEHVLSDPPPLKSLQVSQHPCTLSEERNEN